MSFAFPRLFIFNISAIGSCTEHDFLEHFLSSLKLQSNGILKIANMQSLTSGNDVQQLCQQSLQSNEEIFQILASSNNVKIERIISTGQTTPQDQIYDQETHEYVVLLQGHAKVTLVDENKTIELKSGDAINIPAHQRHVVSYTSSEPPCIWLAIHYN
jgi:cupin 2 domain-containing protein